MRINVISLQSRRRHSGLFDFLVEDEFGNDWTSVERDFQEKEAARILPRVKVAYIDWVKNDWTGQPQGMALIPQLAGYHPYILLKPLQQVKLLDSEMIASRLLFEANIAHPMLRDYCRALAMNPYEKRGFPSFANDYGEQHSLSWWMNQASNGGWHEGNISLWEGNKENMLLSAAKDRAVYILACKLCIWRSNGRREEHGSKQNRTGLADACVDYTLALVNAYEGKTQ